MIFGGYGTACCGEEEQGRERGMKTGAGARKEGKKRSMSECVRSFDINGHFVDMSEGSLISTALVFAMPVGCPRSLSSVRRSL